jgi:uncharacterized protein (TIGR03643 family)
MTEKIHRIKNFNKADISRIIEMAWEDRTSLDSIFRVYGLDESNLKLLMKSELKPKSYTLWRKRMKKSNLRHESLRPNGITRAFCSQQYKHKK